MTAAETDTEFEHDPDHDVLALLQCSKSKQDGLLPAREKYAHPMATLFRKSRDYAETIGVDYLILSGKFGALLPSEPIDDYNVSVRKRDSAAWRQDVLDALDFHGIDFDDYDEVRLLVGKDYRTPLADVFDRTSATVTMPLADCGGLGYMVGRLSDWLDDLDGRDQDTERSGAASCGCSGP